MGRFYKLLRGKPLLVIPRDGFFVVFWRRGLVVIGAYLVIASYFGSTEYLGLAVQNIIDRIATVVLLILLAPVGMSIEHNDDFRNRDEKPSQAAGAAVINQ